MAVHVMKDLEAQAAVAPTGRDSEAILVPQHRLKELAEVMAQTAEILLSVVNANEKYERVAKPRKDRSVGMFSSSHNRLGAIDITQSPDENAHLKVEHNGADLNASVAVTSEELTICRKIAILDDFDRLCTASGKDFGISRDSWRLIGLRDVYTSAPLVAESNPHVVSVLNHRLALAIIRRDLRNPEFRAGVQKEICYGLSRWNWDRKQNVTAFPEGSVRQRGTLDFGPLVAMIGMRLGSFHPSKESNRLRILTALLAMPQLVWHSDQPVQEAASTCWTDNTMVGHVLHHCYCQGVLELPDDGDDSRTSAHLAELTHAIMLLSLWKRGYYIANAEDSAQELSNRRMSSIWSPTLPHESDLHQLPRTQHASFRCRDVSLELLRIVGKIGFEWTEYLEEHLCLDMETLTLKIFWFGFAVQASPIYFADHQDTSYGGRRYNHRTMVKELASTYSLLFRSHSDTYKKNVAEYGRLPSPQWLRVFYGDHGGPLSQSIAENLSYFTMSKRQSRVSDIEFHLAGLDRRLPPTQLFDEYPIWGDRLRMLKAYMDSQKPKGIRGLWQDKRDGLQWYTFWLVVIVGSASVFLSALSLVASVLQTVGTYRGLEQASSG